MAYATIELIEALRTTASNLRNGNKYFWGHQGNCNCGNLVQTITKFNAQEIMKFAQEVDGEWTEIATDYCSTSNAPITLIMQKLQAIGLTPSDIHDLEYLDNKKVLEQLPNGFRWLQRNIKEDVIIYFETFATILEDELLHNINITAVLEANEKVEAIMH